MEYAICNCVQTLSWVVNITPLGVVNCGVAVPVTNMLNVLSRILFKLSVALTVNIVSVSDVTNAGVPDNIPVLMFNTIPLGNDPAKT